MNSILINNKKILLVQKIKVYLVVNLIERENRNNMADLSIKNHQFKDLLLLKINQNNYHLINNQLIINIKHILNNQQIINSFNRTMKHTKKELKI